MKLLSLFFLSSLVSLSPANATTKSDPQRKNLLIKRYSSDTHYRHMFEKLEANWPVRIVERAIGLTPDHAAPDGFYQGDLGTITMRKGLDGNARFLVLVHEASHLAHDVRFRRNPSIRNAAWLLHFFLPAALNQAGAVVHPDLPYGYTKEFSFSEMGAYRKGFVAISQLLEAGLTYGDLTLEETNTQRLWNLDSSMRVAKASTDILREVESWILAGNLKDPANRGVGLYGDETDPTLHVVAFIVKVANGASVQVQIAFKGDPASFDYEKYGLAVVREALRQAKPYALPRRAERGKNE